MAEVQLIATLRPAAGKEEQLREILCQTVGHVTRVEKGCFTFLLTESRGADNVLEFKVIERQVACVFLSKRIIFEEQNLLEGPERIEHLTFISGFVSR
ncbi:hypothetical protein EYZ11_011842 [Aspergillus tanneri]|uniref:ABM domain-containing protein n=1 Tax=Aspergillus tanneri TaxID=1220188 RepID=A0A4S3J3W5_9EURO|nr:hypothetical protein EYZ11_011842 [Aspergillus tanneri]